jgi:thioester reductase-like protein
MAGDAVATTFITGAEGFIGTELVKVFLSRPTCRVNTA